MRTYSERDLIGKEMASNLFGKIFSSFNVHLKMLLPNDIYFRANVLCDDVSEVHETRFNLNDLIEMLLIDFLDEVIKYQNIKEIYSLLIEYDQGTPNVRLLHYQKRNVEEVPLYPIRKKSDDYEEYYCKIDRKLALRAEVMLHDIAQLYPQHPFTVERVLEVLLIDFIEKYRKGEAQTLINDFIKDEVS